MGLFDFAFRSKGERALHKAALHVQKYWEGKKLTNDAISHRQLGNFSEAAQLLKKALLQYDYNPAATIIVGTLMMQDKPKEADILELYVPATLSEEDIPKAAEIVGL